MGYSSISLHISGYCENNLSITNQEDSLDHSWRVFSITSILNRRHSDRIFYFKEFLSEIQAKLIVSKALNHFVSRVSEMVHCQTIHLIDNQNSIIRTKIFRFHQSRLENSLWSNDSFTPLDDLSAIWILFLYLYCWICVEHSNKINKESSIPFSLSPSIQRTDNSISNQRKYVWRHEEVFFVFCSKIIQCQKMVVVVVFKFFLSLLHSIIRIDLLVLPIAFRSSQSREVSFNTSSFIQ